MTERHSMQWLAWVLGVPLEQLLALAANSEEHYAEFIQRRPGKADRTIDNPDELLKEVGRRIRQAFLIQVPLDESVQGCVKGGSPLKSARVFCGHANLARVDIKRCFPSITNRMVYQLYRELGFGPDPARLLTRLTTRRGHLPQGAPTSDRLANLYLRPIDLRLREVVQELCLDGRVRFLDDIGISGRATRSAIPAIVDAVRSLGLAVRHKKTGNAGALRAHVFTGYSVTPQGPKVPKAKKQEIRTAVFTLIREHRQGLDVTSKLRSVQGSIAYLRQTNAGLANRLERQLNESGLPLRSRRRR